MAMPKQICPWCDKSCENTTDQGACPECGPKIWHHGRFNSLGAITILLARIKRLEEKVEEHRHLIPREED